MNIAYSGKSDRGKVRKKNEDSFLIEKLGEDEYLFVVADGMGGHLAGEIASQMACDIIKKGVKEGNRKNPFPLLKRLFEDANRKIYAEGSLDPHRAGMGTTLTVLYIKGNKGYIVHVGDSRAYKIDKARITKLTLDHSLVEKLLREGAISVEEARHHPKRNILYQSVGVYGEIKPQLVGPFTLKEGDALVLCTDGLTDYIEEEEIKNIANNLSAEAAVDRFIKLANERGGGDNITVIVIKMPREEIFEESITRTVKKIGIFRKVDIIALIFVLLLLLGYFLGSAFLKIKAKKIISTNPSHAATVQK